MANNGTAPFHRPGQPVQVPSRHSVKTLGLIGLIGSFKDSNKEMSRSCSPRSPQNPRCGRQTAFPAVIHSPSETGSGARSRGLDAETGSGNGFCRRGRWRVGGANWNRARCWQVSGRLVFRVLWRWPCRSADWRGTCCTIVILDAGCPSRGWISPRCDEKMSTRTSSDIG
jgi:hypothetical protein